MSTSSGRETSEARAVGNNDEDLGCRVRQLEERLDRSSASAALTPRQQVCFSAQVANTKMRRDGVLDFSSSDLLNDGWTIDLENGTFTVPRDGSYALCFTGLGLETNDDNAVSILRNGQQLIATRMRGEKPFTLQVVQKLEGGDRLSVKCHCGGIKVAFAEHDDREYQGPLRPISVFSGFSID